MLKRLLINASTVAAVTMAAMMPGTAAVTTMPMPASLNQANEAYYQEQFDRALAVYERLAEAGDPIAAERAGFMRLAGPSLYGPRIKRDMSKAEALLLQAAKAGQPGAAFMINMLERTE